MGLGALLAVAFLVLDFTRWLRRRPDSASEFKGIGQIGRPMGTHRPTTNEMPPQFRRGRWWYAIWAGAPFHFYKARKRLEFIDSWEKFYAERAKSAVAPRAYVPSERGQPISAPIVPRRARIVFGTGHPFETVAPAGKNKNRTVRVKIENVTDAEIANGTVSILNLDPPQNEHKNFFLKGDISLEPRRHVYVDVAYYSEGTSEAPPGPSMRLCVPIPSGFFFDTLPGTLPLNPHTFHLQFSSLEDHTLDEAYCRIFVDQNHVLHLENRGDSSRMNQI